MANGYTVIRGPDPYVEIDTCADVGGDTCAVTVGDQTYPATPGVDGFHVVVLDRTTLTLQSNHTVSTFADLHTAINVSQTGGDPPAGQPIAHYAANAGQGDQSLVIVQSVGNGTLTGDTIGFIYQDLSQLGDPRGVAGQCRWCAPLRPGRGGEQPALVRHLRVESSTVMATNSEAGQPSGEIDGMLQRDRTGMYTPTGGNLAGGPINSELFSILFQPAQDWPYANDPAIPYIADGIGLSGYPDVRSAYYTDLNIDWDNKANDLTNLDCTGQSFCGEDFDAVKSQLLQEFGWVPTVRGFIDNLLSPYEQTGTGPVFAVDAIYDDISNSLPPPPPAQTSVDWLGIATDSVGLIAAVAGVAAPEASSALYIAGATMQLASDFIQSPDGGSADTVVADAPDDLSAELADQQVATVEAIDRMQTILLYDYGRALRGRHPGRRR